MTSAPVTEDSDIILISALYPARVAQQSQAEVFRSAIRGRCGSHYEAQLQLLLQNVVWYSFADISRDFP